MEIRAGGDTVVSPIELSTELLLNRSVVVNGASMSGKTTIVKDIMYKLKDAIDEAVVVCMTASSGNTFDNIDPQFVHTEMRLSAADDKEAAEAAPRRPSANADRDAAARFLDKIFERQKMRAKMYALTRDLALLKGLFKRVDNDRVQARVRKITHKLDAIRRKIEYTYRRDRSRLHDELAKFDESSEKLLVDAYVEALWPYVPAMRLEQNLTQKERFCLTYFGMNPNFLLVLDDCGSVLKQLGGSASFKQLFYAGRWLYITLLVCCQADTDLPANLRSNAHVTIYTNQPSAITAVSRLGRHEARLIASIAPAVFPRLAPGDDGSTLPPRERFRKLIYVREDVQHWYYYTASLHPGFRFGSEWVHELCVRVGSPDFQLDPTNHFYKRFTE